MKKTLNLAKIEKTIKIQKTQKMNEQKLLSEPNNNSKILSNFLRSPYLPLLETEEKESNPDVILETPQIKKIVLMAIALRLNVTTCLTILRSIDLNQPEAEITNQLLDLYYQDTPNPSDLSEMRTPNLLLRSFSTRLTVVSAKENMVPKPNSLKKSMSSVQEASHVVIEIGGHQQNCPVCFENSPDMRKLPCGDVFCHSCLINYLQARILSSQIQAFKCPAEKCSQFLSEATFESLIKPEEELWKKYQKFKKNEEVAKDKALRWCIRPGCEEIVLKTELENYGKCSCGQEICFVCGGQWHPKEKNCSEAMDEVFKDYLKGADFKHCPKCSQVIEKSVGCNVMACPYCRFTFCWLCLKEYKIGHFSIFNLNGCPGMDSSDVRVNMTKGRRVCECMKGVVGFVLKMIFYVVLGILIYPFLPFLAIWLLMKEHKKNGGALKCDRINGSKICCLVTLGVILGIIGYLTYPIGFIIMFCYMCLWNPHVAYPYQARAQT